MSAPFVDQPYRHFSTEQLLAEGECWRWALTELDAGAGDWEFREQSRAFIEMRLSDLRAEYARRRRLADRPGAPAWPKRSDADLAAELEEIRLRLELAAYVEAHACALVKRGRTLWATCPLPGHREASASFHVDPDKQLWHCFGCDRGGDLFAFAMQFWQIGEFWRVVELLREQAGMEKPKQPEPRFAPAPKPAKRSNGQPERVAFEFRGGRVVGRS